MQGARPIPFFLFRDGCWCLSALLLIFALLPGAVRGDELGPRRAQIQQQVCARCHQLPGIGAPLAGDREEWAARNAKGFEALLANTVNGIGGMPPLGTCGFCTEDDLRALVAFLSGLSTDPPAQAPEP